MPESTASDKLFKTLNFWQLLVAVVVCEAAGIIGSVFTFSSIPTWYAALNKPFFSPPNWIFGPVWIALYFLMGVSLYIIWRSVKTLHPEDRKKGLQYFFAQLLLNTLWSIVFFGIHAIFWALLIIIALWILIFLTIVSFVKVNKTAAILLYPYIAWVSFAAILNFAISFLNT